MYIPNSIFPSTLCIISGKIMFTSQKYLTLTKLRQKEIIASYVKKIVLRTTLCISTCLLFMRMVFLRPEKQNPTSALKKKWQRKILKAFEIQNRVLNNMAIVSRGKMHFKFWAYGLRLHLNDYKENTWSDPFDLYSSQAQSSGSK